MGLFLSRMDSRIVLGRLLEALWGQFLRCFGGRGAIFEVFEHSENHVKFWMATKEGRASSGGNRPPPLGRIRGTDFGTFLVASWRKETFLRGFWAVPGQRQLLLGV